MKEMDLKKAISLVVLAFLGLAILFGGVYQINAGYRGVLLTFGKPTDMAIQEGLHLKIPIAQSIIKMDVRTQKYEAHASSASKDLQIVSADIAVNYHLLPDSVPRLYKEIGFDYQARVIQPTVQEVVKATTAQFTAEELITKRPEAKDKMKELIIERLQGKGLVVEDISIVNFDFSKTFNEAIEAKVTAEQLKLKADRDLQRIEVEAQQVIAMAEAEAKAIDIKGKALRSSPELVQLEAVKKWNGQLPLMSGGGMTPFINVDTFLTAGNFSR